MNHQLILNDNLNGSSKCHTYGSQRPRRPLFSTRHSACDKTPSWAFERERPMVDIGWCHVTPWQTWSKLGQDSRLVDPDWKVITGLRIHTPKIFLYKSFNLFKTNVVTINKIGIMWHASLRRVEALWLRWASAFGPFDQLFVWGFRLHRVDNTVGVWGILAV